MSPRFIFVMAVLWVLFAIALVFSVNFADAHDAQPTAAQPNGWSYPMSCCSGYDCRQVTGGAKESFIHEKPEGYVIDSTHEVIAYGDPRLRDSPDGEYHWCSAGGSWVGRTICLFIPSKGF